MKQGDYSVFGTVHFNFFHYGQFMKEFFWLCSNFYVSRHTIFLIELTRPTSLTALSLMLHKLVSLFSFNSSGHNLDTCEKVHLQPGMVHAERSINHGKRKQESG